jgi:hypothetical protein
MATMPIDVLRRHRLTVDDYHQMAEAGILADDDRVELIEGEVLDMSPIGSLHAALVRVVSRVAHVGLACHANRIHVRSAVHVGAKHHPLAIGREPHVRLYATGTQLTSRSSVGRCLRKRYWPDSPDNCPGVHSPLRVMPVRVVSLSFHVTAGRRPDRRAVMASTIVVRLAIARQPLPV